MNALELRAKRKSISSVTECDVFPVGLGSTARGLRFADRQDLL